MTARYRTEREIILAEKYRDQDISAVSETFNRDAFDALLAIEGCAGLRIYYSMDEALKVHPIIVAVNEANKDILPATGTHKPIPPLMMADVLSKKASAARTCDPLARH